MSVTGNAVDTGSLNEFHEEVGKRAREMLGNLESLFNDLVIIYATHCFIASFM